MSTEEDQPTVTLASWKKNAKHPVTCPSGSRIVIRIPDLPAMIETGEIPQSLLDAALGAAAGAAETPTVEVMAKQREFTDHILMKSVVEPKLTAADVADIPYEDKEFLVAVATRQRDLDAEGEHIGGLTKSEKFRRFRKLREFDSDVESL